MKEALLACGAPVVASYTLAGGVLTGKYDDDPNAGRAAGQLDEPMYAAARQGERRGWRSWPRRLDTTPAALAVAFALGHPDVATGAVRRDIAGAGRYERRRGSTWRPTSAPPIAASWRPSVADRQYL